MPNSSVHGVRSILLGIGMCLLLGCNDGPPITRTKADIARLPPSSRSVRARSLHDADIAELARLKQLRYLDFGSGCGNSDASITDEGLSSLALNLPNLEELDLAYCDNITDSGLEHLTKLKLKLLIFHGCPRITDKGLLHLSKMKTLRLLFLDGCAGVTDDGLSHLSEKLDWEVICLDGCPNITGKGVQMLQGKHPNARITKNDADWELNRCR